MTESRMDCIGNLRKDNREVRWGLRWLTHRPRDIRRKQGKQQPYHGYFYRILTKQGANVKGGAKDYIVNGKMTGGFALVAYPERYGDTGITTFIMNKDGVLYQKDLGKNTADSAKAVTEFNPDKTWIPAID